MSTTAPMSNGSIPNGSTSNGHTPTSISHAETYANSKDASKAATAVLKPSIPMPSTSTQIRGIDFNDYTSPKSPVTVKELTEHFMRTGFQASNLGKAIEIINNMVPQLFLSRLREYRNADGMS